MKSKQTYFQWQKGKKIYWIINLILSLLLGNVLPSNLKWISLILMFVCLFKVLEDYVIYLQVHDIQEEIESKKRKRERILFNTIVLLLLGFMSVEFLMTKFGAKKYYEVVEGSVIVKDSLTEGIIAYKGTAPGEIFFKWNISSIKEIKHKSDPVK